MSSLEFDTRFTSMSTLLHSFAYNLTKNVAFVRAVALDENEEKPVAMAAGAFVTGG